MSTLFPIFFLGVFLLVAAVFVFSFRTQAQERRDRRQGTVLELDDARAASGRWVNRLGDELLVLEPTDGRSRELLGLAAQRHADAVTRLGAAQTPAQAALAGDVALEGLHLMRDARRHLGEPEGPPLPDVL